MIRRDPTPCVAGDSERAGTTLRRTCGGERRVIRCKSAPRGTPRAARDTARGAAPSGTTWNARAAHDTARLMVQVGATWDARAAHDTARDAARSGTTWDVRAARDTARHIVQVGATWDARARNYAAILLCGH